MEATKPVPSGRESLGDILVDMGVITQAQLDEARQSVDSRESNLFAVLAEKGFASEERLLKSLSRLHRVPYFTSFNGLLDPAAARLVPQKMARTLLVVPIRVVKKGLLLGMANPVDVVTIDTITGQVKMKVLPVLTTRLNLFESIRKAYGDLPTAEPAPKPKTEQEQEAADPGAPMPASSVKILPHSGDPTLTMRNVDDTSVIDVVDRVIADAVGTKASDIHLEPTPTAFRMRLRLDGLLQDRRVFSKEMESAIVARIKILSRLDITETRLPQDGHIAVDYGGREVDLRVSTLPTIYGEKVVIRVLDHTNSRRTLPDLGLPLGVSETFSNVIRRPNGMILVTGPTGSGKTTTLYAALNEINTPDKNIVTLEDPVEYRLPGINQMETNIRINLTFATGLRAILRQDPNVILVGEIRDLETAEIAVQAAVTGHMVFSTLHTKDAVGTVARLLNIRTEPFLLATALSGVLAQRLVRVLCPKCKVSAMPTEQQLARIGVPLKIRGPFFMPKGCDTCLRQGYTGRVGIYEWLLVNREIRSLILEGASSDQLRETARAEGMTTLQEDGLEKVYKGMTSLDEVIRVTHEEDEEKGEAEASAV